MMENDCAGVTFEPVRFDAVSVLEDVPLTGYAVPPVSPKLSIGRTVELCLRIFRAAIRAQCGVGVTLDHRCDLSIPIVETLRAAQ